MRLVLGAMAPDLKEQLKPFMVDEEVLGRMQMDADAITRLHLRGMLTDSEAERARKRLMPQINQAIIA